MARHFPGTKGMTMTDASGAAAQAGATPEANAHDPLAGGFPPGFQGQLLFWIAVAFSAFQVVTAFGIPLDFRLIGSIAWLTPITLIRVAFVLWLVWIVIGQRAGIERDQLEGAE